MSEKNKYTIIILVFLGFGFMITTLFMLLSPAQLYSNQYLISKYQNEYYRQKGVFNDMASFFEKFDFDESVMIHYGNGFIIDPYDNPKYYFLKESSFIRKNEYFFRNYYTKFYKSIISFCTSGFRNKQGEYVTLIRCQDIEEYDPYCTIYSGQNYPKDTDTNCMYHIEGDWYVRVP